MSYIDDERKNVDKEIYGKQNCGHNNRKYNLGSFKISDVSVTKAWYLLHFSVVDYIDKYEIDEQDDIEKDKNQVELWVFE